MLGLEMRRGGSEDALTAMDTAAAAHDFGNMLQCAMSALRLCDRELRKRRDEDLVLMVGDALGAIERAALLGHRMAGGARQVSNARWIGVGDEILGLRPLLRHALGEGVRLDTLIDEPLPAIWCDPSDLENVLLNLAINAREAMPGGGLLVVEAATSRGSPGARGGVSITVRDTGSGMSAAVAAHAFTPSFSTKGGRGRGMGLATVERFVRGMGGTAEIAAGESIGTCIRLHLPALAPSALDSGRG